MCPARHCAMSMVIGSWRDRTPRSWPKKKYVISATPHKDRLRVDVFDIETAEWLFGGAHLIRICPERRRVVWGARVDRYYCDLDEVAKTSAVSWFCCDAQRSQHPSWQWIRAALPKVESAAVCRAPYRELELGEDVYAASEYDLDLWVPAKTVAFLEDDDIVVSTQDGSHKWTVSLIGGVVSAR